MRPGSATRSIATIFPLLPAVDGEGEHDSLGCRQEPKRLRGSVHNRRKRDPGTPREGAGDSHRTADLPQCTDPDSLGVGAKDYVWVEKCNQPRTQHVEAHPGDGLAEGGMVKMKLVEQGFLTDKFGINRGFTIEKA